MTPADADCAPESSGDDGHMPDIQFVFLAVQRFEFFAIFCIARDNIAAQFFCIENVQGAREIEGDVIGDVHQRRNGFLADGFEAFLSQSGLWPFFTPLMVQPINCGQFSAWRWKR